MRIDIYQSRGDWGVYLNDHRVEQWQVADDVEGWVEGFFYDAKSGGVIWQRKYGKVRLVYESGLLRGLS